METVTGIGGFFFRSRDPAALARWYDLHLGVKPVPSSYNETSWHQQAGPTAFSPFPETTDYFGSAEQGWMINFRVRDLNAIAAQLRANGITVEIAALPSFPHRFEPRQRSSLPIPVPAR